MTSNAGGLPAGTVDPTVPLLNLSAVRSRMDYLQRFLSESVNSNTLIGKDQMDMVSAEISSAIHQIILNGAALLASATPAAPILQPSDASDPVVLKVEGDEDQDDQDEDKGAMDCEVVEIDAVELLAEHVHFCDICGKGFKRDANLRMHMRAHGNQFKTPEALAKPQVSASSEASAFGAGRTTTKFSCPYDGCNRNRKHKKFRPLKSVICVRNHFKRSHCPKMYSCNRCNKKSFSVVADLKSHLKHCGESKWKCTCGTSFSRKDKLFGHMALFEGHMPAVAAYEEESNNDNDNRNSNNEVKVEEKMVMMKVEEEEEEEEDGSLLDDNMGFFDGLLDGFDSIDGFNLQEVLESPNYNGGTCWGVGGGEIEGFYGGGVGL